MNTHADAEALPPGLRCIGWNALCAQALAQLPPDTPGRPARIVEQHRGHCVVHDGVALLRTLPLPALFDRLEQAGDGLAVGDWVLVVEDGGSLYISERLARSSLLQRSRGENGVQRIVANVDTAVLVMALDGDYNPNRMERYLLMVRAASVAPLIVLTKPDRCEDLEARRQEIAMLAGDAAVYLLDARTPAVLRVFAPYLAEGQTLVLLGSSGVGKSTLMNTLLGAEAQRTGSTREYDDRGRHTTTTRTLRLLPGGACLIDTPGIRELRLGGDEDVAADAFDDIRALAQNCRFRDCRHEQEPGCAVTSGLPPARLANYRKLRGELAQQQQARQETKAPKLRDKTADKASKSGKHSSRDDNKKR